MHSQGNAGRVLGWALGLVGFWAWIGFGSIGITELMAASPEKIPRHRGGDEVCRDRFKTRRWGSSQRKPNGREDLRFDPSALPELAGITDVGVHST